MLKRFGAAHLRPQPVNFHQGWFCVWLFDVPPTTVSAIIFVMQVLVVFGPLEERDVRVATEVLALLIGLNCGLWGWVNLQSLLAANGLAISPGICMAYDKSKAPQNPNGPRLNWLHNVGLRRCCTTKCRFRKEMQYILKETQYVLVAAEPSNLLPTLRAMVNGSVYHVIHTPSWGCAAMIRKQARPVEYWTHSSKPNWPNSWICASPGGAWSSFFRRKMAASPSACSPMGTNSTRLI